MLLLLLSTAACPIDSPCPDVQPPDDPPRPEAYLKLDARQQRAVVSIAGTVDGKPTRCSAVLVDRWHLLSAAHCDLVFRAADGRAWIADQPLRAEVVRHPELDLLVATLESAAPASVMPVDLIDHPLDDGTIDALAVAAGRGVDGQGGADGQIFAVGRIAAVDVDTLEFRDPASAGPCDGDSGGPLLLRGADGLVRVIGVLHSSTLDCQTRATYLRADVVREWVRAQGVESSAGSCGDLGEAGRCFGSRAIWCEAEQTHVEDCVGRTCAWSEAQQGWRCVDDDPCAGIDERGLCEEGRATTCQEGLRVDEECAACGLVCGRDPASYQVRCE